MSNFIFVGGCGHSGTSLITAILGAHSRIFAIPVETGVFLKSLTDTEIRKTLDDLVAANTKPNLSYFCEKTPGHVLRSKEIIKVYPNAKLVFIVRDPRDVVASFKRREVPPTKSIARWTKANKAVLAARRTDNSHVVKFEELVADTKGTLIPLCKFLGIEFQDGMLDYWKDDREWFDAKERRAVETPVGEGHRVHRNWQIHQPIMNNRVGTFQDELSPAEIRSICDQTSKIASRFGYELAEETENQDNFL